MAFPNKKELDRVRKKLESVEPVRLLSENASEADNLKFELCKKFVIHLRENKITQIELADQLGIDPARINEIVRYKIDLFTIDRLLEYAERLNPKIKISVA